ncbi:MAG: hypothetical protein B1H06_02530 [Candidatus Cloacimonas sp. 4484_143]|nr:MAG: hypothetical protein B1H06_02530 [Candidatus Cloacimonas sp. 4484_143]
MYFEKIGNINFIRSKRAKRLRIILRPFKSIRVSVPYGISQNSAKTFVLSKEDWIKKQLVKIQSYEENVRKAQENIEEIDFDKASKVLKERLIALSVRFNFSFNRVTFRKQKTRWGSCSAKNNLSLNIKLYKLPLELQDYVLLHELVHTTIKNHSQHFWQELEELMPGAKRLDKELKKYQLMVL